MEGNRIPSGRSRSRRLAVALAATALAGTAAACGDDGSPTAGGEPAGRYPVKVTTAEFPTAQRLGQTTLLRLGVRNAGRRTVPSLTVTISVGGEEGAGSSLPFAVRDPQPGLAQPDRPVWVLSATYPRLRGSSDPGGAESADQKTFSFGPLERGETVEAVWKLSAVREGDFTLLYEIDAGLRGEAKAVTSGGTAPGGSFEVEITAETPNTIVTDSGEVVEVGGGERRGGRRGERNDGAGAG